VRAYRFHPAASEEADAAARNYEAARAGLGREFIADLDACIAIAREFPDAGTPYSATTRRLLFRRFPFSLIYRADSNEVEIVAVAHQRREPGYWRQRVR
jgi:plasmid stabilization system protein ParE